MTSGRRITQSELLQWSVLHTATLNEDAPQRTEPLQTEPIDPKWIEAILGKEDAVRMRECVERITDASLVEEDRVTAFDELELLVESIDNANDLRPLKLWPSIVGMLASDSPALRLHACWVLGTAVQNNPRAQQDFLDCGGLEPTLRVLEQDTDSNVRAKALYCVSGAIRHNLAVFDAFHSLQGFRVVANALQNAEPGLLRRGVFFWKALLLDDQPTVALRAANAAIECGIVSMAVHLADSADLDLLEKCLDLIAALNSTITFDDETKKLISSVFVPNVEAKAKSLASQGENIQEVDRLMKLI